MHSRSFRWLRARVLGLMAVPPIGFREVSTGKGTRAEPLWGTRIQFVLHTPREGASA